MKRFLSFTIITIIAAAFDLVTKALVESRFALYESKKIIDDFFSLTYVRNPGAAFGIFAEAGELRTTFFIAVTIFAMFFILWFLKTHGDDNKFMPVWLGLIFGGALGNLVDRVRYGEVVDFLDFYVGKYHWPAFNVADSTILVGITAILITELFLRKETG